MSNIIDKVLVVIDVQNDFVTGAFANEDAIIFDSAEKMKEYIADHFYKVHKYKMFNIDDIVLNGEKEGHEDERIGWHDVRYVCVKRMGEEVYDHLQCIGMWATEWE